MTATTSDTRPGVGGYEVLAELESGGMGEVYIARRRGAHGFAKLVALKTIRRDRAGSDDVRSMFLDEARLVARLDHPAIAQVHDFGEQDGSLYLAMEYIAGLPFTELIERQPRIPAGVAVRAIAEVCRGLHAAHEAVDLDGTPLGVVHRDVSPANLMMTFEGSVKILDFGIARTDDRVAPETQTGIIKGKPAYMAPEQLVSSAVDRRADVFSASVVLHELLTGQRLFSGDNVFALADAVRSGRIAPPSEIAGELPDGLDAVVLRGLERQRDQRFQTAAEMADALDRIAARAGVEPLEAFANRELQGARDEHRERLHDLTTTGESSVELPGAGRGRPSGVETIAETGTALPPTRLRRQAAHESTGHAVAAAGLGRTRMWRAAGVVMALAAAGTAVMIWTTREAGVEPSAVADAPSAVPSPAAVEAQGPSEVDTPSPAAAEPVEQPVAKPAAKRRRTKKKRTGHEAKAPAAPIEDPPPPPPGAFGFLRVTAKPYANVRIDGRLVGPTPLMHHRLPAGEHEVELLSPETGEVRLTRRVEVSDGRTSTVSSP
jgi:serine/threonine-protein kinase